MSQPETTVSKNTCVVVFAEGYTGMTLMQELAARSKELHFNQIIAIVDKDRKAESKDIQNMKTDLFRVDHYDSDDVKSVGKVLEKYKEGMNTLILIPPAQQHKEEFCKGSLHLFDDEQVKDTLKCFLLVSSILTAECVESQEVFKEFMDIENLCKSKCPENATCCIIRPGFYSQNLLLYTPQIQNGELPLPIGSKKLNMVDLADVGLAMVEVIINIHQEMSSQEQKGVATQSKFHGKTIDMLGTEMVSGNELAEMLTKVMDKDIKFKDISNNEAAKLLSLTNLIDPYEAQYLLSFYSLVKQGKLEQVMEQATKPENNMFQQLTKSKPTSMNEFLIKYKQDLIMPIQPGAFKRMTSGPIEE